MIPAHCLKACSVVWRSICINLLPGTSSTDLLRQVGITRAAQATPVIAQATATKQAAMTVTVGGTEKGACTTVAVTGIEGRGTGEIETAASPSAFCGVSMTPAFWALSSVAFDVDDLMLFSNH